MHPSSSAQEKRTKNSFKSRDHNLASHRSSSHIPVSLHRPHGSGNRKLCNLRSDLPVCVDQFIQTIPPDHGTSWCQSSRQPRLTKTLSKLFETCFFFFKLRFARAAKPFLQFHHGVSLFGRETLYVIHVLKNRHQSLHHEGLER